MPHSVETEKAVIGALLVESNAIEDVVGILNPDIFYEESLGKIYAVIAKLYEENTRIDLVTVYKALCSPETLKRWAGRWRYPSYPGTWPHHRTYRSIANIFTSYGWPDR